MKITNKRLKLLSYIVILAGAIVVILTEKPGDYIGIGIMVLGMILMMPWVKEKKE